MSENEVDSDSDLMIEIRRQERVIEAYRKDLKEEKIWRRLGLFMAFVMVSRLIYDLWM